MSTMILTRGERTLQVFDCAGPVHIGRASTNDIVLLDEMISSHHCVLWPDDDGIWVEDLGSSNGTWHEGARLTEPLRLGPEDRVTLGGAGGPILQPRPDTPQVVGGSVWQLEDPLARMRLPVRSDRFRIGAGAGCDLRLAEGPELAATLLLHDSGEVWLGVDEDDRRIEPGEVFEVAGRRLHLVAPEAGRPPTLSHDPNRYDYRVAATLAGIPRAVVEDRRGGPRWSVEDDNRALLLYMLARQLERDRADVSIPPATRGWIDDSELVQGVWGRNRPADEINSLNVLIHRVRRGVKSKGLDPWFLEKQHRSVRIRVAEVRVD